jgi:S-DNA-T family DNA segregation ATPase FtsK/SpoIIIE
LWGVVLVLVGALGLLSVLTDTAGVVGDQVRSLGFLLFGTGAYAVPVLLLAGGLWMTLAGKPIVLTWRVGGVVLALYLCLVILHLPVPVDWVFDRTELLNGGGWFGAVGAWGLAVAFGTAGRLLVLVGLSVLAGLAITQVSPGRALGLLLAGVRWVLVSIARQWLDFVAAVRSRRDVADDKPSFRETQDGRLIRADKARRRLAASADGDEDEPGDVVPPGSLPAGQSSPSTGATRGNETPGQGLTPSAVEADRAASNGASAKAPVSAATNPAVTSSAQAGLGAATLVSAAMPSRPYALPPLTLLRRGPKQRPGRAAQDAETRAQVLEETFSSFGVGVKVMEINPGPTVTRFEVRPAPGVKVSRIEALADDIALSLAAADVRIAPIPGKGLVGVEVPNIEVSVVYLREVLESAEFGRAQSKLTFAVGKDIAGQVILADLEKLLHLLIAGATGSGKSVCLNSLIASILFKASPEEVKLLLIDPKVVEFQVFDGIPHLLAPVINDPKKASQVLRWAVKEMLDRYFRFSEYGVRNISDYNRLMAELAEVERAEQAEAAAAGASPAARKQQPAQPAAAAQAGHPASAADNRNGPLPHIIIVIDELADLMMVAPVEVEDSIWRLAQMARAAGIHLVVATQRPSVNVITGVIKANIPSRIAFAVASQVDSRTILDIGGAEKLLGRGDMLFYPVGASKPLRVQGALITDREVEELVQHVKRQADPRYMESFPVPDDAAGDPAHDLDERWGDALRVIFDGGQASTSMLQRRLRIGYTRAARIVDMMEEMGIVAKSDGVKPRDVLMTMEQYAERYGPLDGKDSPGER